jgi:RecA-family ATPase
MAFKTFVDLRIAYSICTGVDFFGHQVFSQGKVLYICGEGKGALSRRMKALKIVEGDFLGNLLVLEQHMAIDNAVSMAELMLDVQRIKPVLVIFDTFSSLVSGIDENSNSEVARALKLIKETCAGASSLIVHHYGKDAARGSRGAVAFKANVDFELSLVRETDTMNTVLSCVKMKDGELFPNLNLTAHIVDLGLVGQDGHNSCSLVLKSNSMALNEHESKCLQALKDAIILDGVDFEGGCGTSEEHWRKSAYKILTGKNKSRDFSTAKKKLLEIGRIEDKKGLFCA